jgi:hypothetical protein
MRRPPRGILLLPVALALAVIGTLAYALVRDGAIAVAAVDADYETEAARYLAEGGLQLVKWHNERLGCKSAAGIGKLDLPGNAGSVETSLVKTDDKFLTISLVAYLPAPGERAPTRAAIVNRKVRVHDRFDPKSVTLTGSGGNDTTISSDVNKGQDKQAYLKLTDDSSHGLLKFPLDGDLDNATVYSAQLTLTQFYSNSTQPQRSIAFHRIIRDWPAGATWSDPWTAPGGDYAARPSVRLTLDPVLDNRQYTFGIEGLVQAWADKTIDNQGMLLKPSGLVNARFRSLDDAIKPTLVVRYYPRC